MRDGWGPTIKARTAWIIMEAPSPISFAIVFLMSPNATNMVPLILAGMFMMHYVYRAFIFPFRMRGADKPKPVFTALLAFVFHDQRLHQCVCHYRALAPPHDSVVEHP
ncbi:MAG: hypothetical protein R3A47_01680 [Polyangiales bacterium]